MKSIPFTECVDLVGSRCKPFKGTKKYVSTGAVDVDQINEAGIEIIDYEKRPSRANLEASLGDVLFAKMQGTKKTLLISSSLVENIYSTGFCAVKAKENVLTERCLYHLLTSKMFLEQKDKNCSGATQKAITNKGLQKVILHVPDINKQDLIAAQLDLIVKIITLRKQELVELDDLIKARFVELFGNPLDGTAKYPIHQVGEVANSVDPQPSHRTPPIDEDGIPYVSTKDCDYKTGKIDFEGARKVSRGVLEEHLNRYTLHDGDFIIGKIGTIGKPVFVPAREDYTLSANVVLVQPNSDLVSPYFLKYSFESDFVERQFAEAKNSTSQAAFGIQKVRTVKVMNPNLNIQRGFEDFVKQIDKSKATVQKALDETQLLFDSLMQQYFG